MSHYILGAAPMPREWVPTKTCEGDSLTTLAFAYNSTEKEIAAKNGISWDTAKIQDWVMSTGGKMLPYNPKSYPFPTPSGRHANRKNEGWAVFTLNSSILLPSMSRVDGRIPGTGVGDLAPAAGEKEGDKDEGRKISWTRTALLVGFLGWAGYAVYGAMKPSKKKSPAPVNL